MNKYSLNLGNKKKPYQEICNKLKIIYNKKTTIKQLKEKINEKQINDEPKLEEINEKQIETQKKNFINIENCDGLTFLQNIKNNSIDLILTDPPYIISKETGMNSHYNNVKENEKNNKKYIKTEAEWIAKTMKNYEITFL